MQVAPTRNASYLAVILSGGDWGFAAIAVDLLTETRLEGMLPRATGSNHTAMDTPRRRLDPYRMAVYALAAEVL